MSRRKIRSVFISGAMAADPPSGKRFLTWARVFGLFIQNMLRIVALMMIKGHITALSHRPSAAATLGLLLLLTRL
ncbi:hypothetical protein SAMN04488045_2950 [Thalassococcus halodurans]|uniref:Uncharacterized protein n=1 Tax=Thalassococcus halodurans TaxID=373675 RepID=A0A1H6AH91_9RHOB|nr:hypothetical protein SAMN04488045_2950 [Thalassococcus halodurans]